MGERGYKDLRRVTLAIYRQKKTNKLQGGAENMCELVVLLFLYMLKIPIP